MINNENDFIPLERARSRGHHFAPANQDYITPHLEGLINLGALQGKPVPPRRWLVSQWIPLGTVTMLNGDGGTGKSILALQLLAASALGKSWIGQPTMRCKSIGIFCEDSEEEISRRMADINLHYGADFSDLEDLTLHSLFGEENALLDFSRDEWRWNTSERYHQITRAIGDSGAQLIVLDSLHDLFPGNENARPEARRFIQMLAAWALNHDAAVVLNAHPSLSGLNTGSGTSGSTAWNNAVRSRLYLSRLKQENGGDDGLRTLTRFKANYASTGDALTLKWADGVFVNQEQPTGIMRTIENERIDRIFLNCLDAATAQCRALAESKNAQSYAPKIMATMKEAEGVPTGELRDAMLRLFNAGTIAMGSPFIKPNRHPAVGIVRATKRTGTDG